MCYPLNEFETDLEKPYKPPGGWIYSSSCPVETSMVEAVKGNGISTAMKRGRDFYSTAAKRDGNKIESGKVALHKKSYPKVLAGISAGTLLAFVIACRLGGKFG